MATRFDNQAQKNRLASATAVNIIKEEKALRRTVTVLLQQSHIKFHKVAHKDDDSEAKNFYSVVFRLLRVLSSQQKYSTIHIPDWNGFWLCHRHRPDNAVRTLRDNHHSFLWWPVIQPPRVPYTPTVTRTLYRWDSHKTLESASTITPLRWSRWSNANMLQRVRETKIFSSATQT